MQIFALGILVVQIAEREGHPELAPFYLGLMGLARAVPGLVLTLLRGAVADRVGGAERGRARRRCVRGRRDDPDRAGRGGDPIRGIRVRQSRAAVDGPAPR